MQTEDESLSFSAQYIPRPLLFSVRTFTETLVTLLDTPCKLDLKIKLD